MQTGWQCYFAGNHRFLKLENARWNFLELKVPVPLSWDVDSKKSGVRKSKHAALQPLQFHEKKVQISWLLRKKQKEFW